MPPASKKPQSISFTDCSGGVNSIEHPIRINNNQVQPNTIGCILKKSGFEKYPGVDGLTSSTTFTTYLRMLSMYQDLDGNERLIALSGGVLSSVTTTGGSRGSLTTLFNMTGTGEGWACTAYGKHFVCNGGVAAKIEETVAYQIGITPPSGVLAVAALGGSLPDGTYSVYVSYGRRVSGVDKLYSDGEYLGEVVLGSGYNQIAISNFANSSDLQVGQKVVWVKNVTSGEIIHYFFYATNDNSTEYFNISSDAAKDTSSVFEYEALGYIVPPAATYIYYFANRLWMLYENTLYYSEKSAGNEYNLEKFRAEFTVVIPHICTGIFSIGVNLYINTNSGIIIFASADPTTEAFLIEPRWHFAYMRTVAHWNNGVIGVTNDGVRYFNGDKFTDYDISLYIKNIINAIYDASVSLQPCGFVYKRSIRNEYHLMWRDAALGDPVNNVHAVLNLDTFYYADPYVNTMAWEFHQYSGNYYAISYASNTLFIGQSHGVASKIYEELVSSDMSNNCYTRSGQLLTESTAHELYLKTKVYNVDLISTLWIQVAYFLLQNQADGQFRITIADEFLVDTGILTIPKRPDAGGDAFYWDISAWDEAYFAVETAQIFKKKVKELRGKTCYVEIMQTDNDPTFKLMQMDILGYKETGNTL